MTLKNRQFQNLSIAKIGNAKVLKASPKVKPFTNRQRYVSSVCAMDLTDTIAKDVLLR